MASKLVKWMLILAAAEHPGGEIVEVQPFDSHMQSKEGGEEEISRTHKGRRDMITLSWSPRIFLFPGFLHRSTCQRFINESAQHMVPSIMHGPKTPSEISEAMKYRRSSVHFFPRRDEMKNSFVGQTIQRIHNMLMLPISHGEPLQVVSYKDAGDKYEFHHDSASELGRLATVIVYLNDVPIGLGGETIFPLLVKDAVRKEGHGKLPAALNLRKLREPAPPLEDPQERNDSPIQKMAPYCDSQRQEYLKIRPRQGDALVFYSHDPSTRLDEYAWHGACPILEGGEKWVLQRWVRLSPDPNYERDLYAPAGAT
jgi:prolyl 4-hydroxylase